MVEKASAPPKEDTIEEEADDTTLESNEEPAAEEPTDEPAEVESTKEEEEKKTGLGCCDTEVIQNMKAACGLAA